MSVIPVTALATRPALEQRQARGSEPMTAYSIPLDLIWLSISLMALMAGMLAATPE